MDKINLVVGDNFEDVNKAVVKKINIKDLSKKNLVIVPDRFSLLCEKLIFESLNIESYFNIEVMGISLFAKQVFEKLNCQFEYVDKIESKIIIRKAINNVKNKMRCFVGEINQQIVDLIFNSVISFKTNKVAPQEVFNSAVSDNFLSAKLMDLSLIYEEYERLLNNRLDGSNVLTKLEELAEGYDFSSSNIFYVGFDGFTKQALSVMKVVAKTANSLTVGAIKPKIQNNSYIFDDEIYNNILALGEDKNLSVEVEEVSSTLSEKQKIFHKNLFSLRKEKVKIEQESFVHVFEGNDARSEIEKTAKLIKNLVVRKNVKFNEICVACGNLSDYQNLIENIFNKYGIATYVDCGEKLKNNPFISFCLSFLKILNCENERENFMTTALSVFSPLEKEEKIALCEYVEKFGKKFNILGRLEDENIQNVINKIKKVIENLKLKLNNGELNYIEIFNQIIENFNLEEKLTQKSKDLLDNGFIKESKLFSAIMPAVEITLKSVEKSLDLQDISLGEFIEILESVFAEQEIATIPLSVDSVFVGDITTSYFAKCDYVFVLGANSNSVPRINSDIAILSDDILEKISDKIVLTPTVKMINRRNRFKAFGQLLNFNKELFVMYSLNGSSGEKLLPSVVVKDILEIFGKEILVSIREEVYSDLIDKSEEEQHKIFAYLTGVKSNAKSVFLKQLETQVPILKNIMITLNKEFGDAIDKNKQFYEIINPLNNKIDKKILFFKNFSTKISQIENYFACPFKHFMQYGLKLKENPNAVVNTANVGSFLHKVAEEFLKEKNDNIQKIRDKKAGLKNIVAEIVNKTLKNKSFQNFTFLENAVALELLKEESVSLCEYLYETYFKSKLKPKYLEFKFGDENKFLLNVENENFGLVGIVDRIDVCDDKCVIIDYKSGTSTKGNDKELYYGEKLQVFAYAEAIKQILNLKPYGVYYFPISNKFDENDSNRYKLKGKSVENEDFLLSMDTTLSDENRKSNIFPCSLNSASSKNKFKSTSSMVNEAVFKDMCEYAIAMIKNAISEILEGITCVSPTENACAFCPYVSICQKSDTTAIREFEEEVKSGSFSLNNETKK